MNSYSEDKFIVTGCTFTKNKVTTKQGSGGAIYSSSKTIFQITKSKFTENSAVYNGGAIMAYSKGKSAVSGCSFTKNKVTGKSGSAGAIDFECLNDGTLKSETKITNSKFTKNSATVSSGAITYEGREKYKFTVSGCTFTSNKATNKKYGRGGAIGLYGHKSIYKITNSKFTKNIAGKKYNALFYNLAKVTKKNVKITPKDGTKV